MFLSSKLKSAFGSGDRTRGIAYAESGAVLEMEVVKGILHAKVGGTYGHYDVTVDVANPTNYDVLSCNCRRFDAGYNCKHIWATILEYETEFGSAAKKQAASNRIVLTKDAVIDPAAKAPAAPTWQTLLAVGSDSTVEDEDEEEDEFEPASLIPVPTSEVLYVVDVSPNSASEQESLDLVVLQRNRKQNGRWGRLNRLSPRIGGAIEIDDELDRNILWRLRRQTAIIFGDDVAETASNFEFRVEDNNELIDLLVSTERLFWSVDEDFDPDQLYLISTAELTKPCWVRMDLSDSEETSSVTELRFVIERGELGGVIPDDQIVNITDDGSGLSSTSLFRIGNPDAIALWRNARAYSPVEIKKRERGKFLEQLALTPGVPRIQIPDSWGVKVVDTPSNGLIRLKESPFETDFNGEVHFTYGDVRFPLGDYRSCAFNKPQKEWVQRDSDGESRLLSALHALPFINPIPDSEGNGDFQMNRTNLIELVDGLGGNGWEIILMGRKVRRAGEFEIAVVSGLDWFDLEAEVDFDGQSIPLPSLLKAMNRKEDFIRLADGSTGRVPVELIQKYAQIAQFGDIEDGKIRFNPSQAMLLDAMLATKEEEQVEIKLDKGFKQFRKKLQSFSGVKPKTPPHGFQGELRKYQQDGLGWLHFLREFKLGGCLADDMGLGKTVQVLALLESRRTRRLTDGSKKTKRSAPQRPVDAKDDEEFPLIDVAATLKRKPSLVVVPKSLIFNWIDEAAKFAPKLRFLNYTGSDRKSRASGIDCFDVVITTYGTMRKDITELTSIEFDYAILDESQAIKNAKAQCAKASRLIRADHRLAMTGTPIENHLGELWSLFEFLNPGMLGGSRQFAGLIRQKKGCGAEEEHKDTIAALSRALQPFILRRTKEQVLTDLPAKTEQTLYCDMTPKQKKKYEELKEYYRVKLNKQVETEGLANAKIQILEALLRLRQVACDPRLMDDEARPGAKIELLAQQLGEVVSEGHKVLVFSQFTKLLGLVRDQFDKDGIEYEYLDGKTSNRKKCVKRFQENPNVSTFLISLKAGGHGLNLTAADYVYLLDPWWNPAVEAQAIDRAHRMGQQRPVIAYRMICRETVEEKIVELQQSKQELADSIIRADESLIRSLTTDDLQLLLG